MEDARLNGRWRLSMKTTSAASSRAEMAARVRRRKEAAGERDREVNVCSGVNRLV